jgi:hypothetical protein
MCWSSLYVTLTKRNTFKPRVVSNISLILSEHGRPHAVTARPHQTRRLGERRPCRSPRMAQNRVRIRQRTRHAPRYSRPRPVLKSPRSPRLVIIPSRLQKEARGLIHMWRYVGSAKNSSSGQTKHLLSTLSSQISRSTIVRPPLLPIHPHITLLTHSRHILLPILHLPLPPTRNLERSCGPH